MSLIQTVADVDNAFLARREITCNFAGLAGRLRRLEAADMITKEFGLDGKLVIPVRLRTHVGKPLVTGTFYVYEDEGLAKKHVNPTVFARLEKTRAKEAEARKAEEEKAAEAKKAEDEKAAGAEGGDKPEEAAEVPAAKPDGESA